MNESKSSTTEPVTSAQSVPRNETSKKSHKGLIIGLVIGGIALLAIIVGLLIYFANYYISKTDYTNAANQTNVVIDRYNKMQLASENYVKTDLSATASDTDVSRARTNYLSAYSAYKESVTKLANERAMKKDEVKNAYNAFATKHNEFVKNESSVADAMPAFHKVAVNCSEQKVSAMDTSDLSKLVTSYDTAMNPCVNSMKELASSKNSDMAKFANNALSSFADMRTHIVAMQDAYGAQDRGKFENEYNAFMDKANSFSKDTDISSIAEHQTAFSPTDELNKLASTIRSQIR